MLIRTIKNSLICTIVVVLIFLLVSISASGEIRAKHYPFFDGSNVSTGEIVRNMTVGQTFVADDNNLDRLDILFGTNGRTNSNHLILHIKGMDQNNDIRTITIPSNTLIDNVYNPTHFDPIQDSKGKKYYFFIESTDASVGNAVSIWILTSNNYKQGDLIINNKSDNKDMAFIPYYKTRLINLENDLLDKISLNKPWFITKIFLISLAIIFVFLVSIIGITIIKNMTKISPTSSVL